MSVNQQQFSNMHEQYRDRLLNRMTAFAKNHDEAEDITAAALATAFEKRGTFRGESSLYTCYVVCPVMWCVVDVDVGVASRFKV